MKQKKVFVSPPVLFDRSFASGIVYMMRHKRYHMHLLGRWTFSTPSSFQPNDLALSKNGDSVWWDLASMMYWNRSLTCRANTAITAPKLLTSASPLKFTMFFLRSFFNTYSNWDAKCARWSTSSKTTIRQGFGLAALLSKFPGTPGRFGSLESSRQRVGEQSQSAHRSHSDGGGKVEPLGPWSR